MPNIRKKKSEKTQPRCVSLSDNDLKEIKKLTGEKSLTAAIKKLVVLAKDQAA